MRRVITFGTFDVLHIGHIRILKRARAEGDALIVGLSSDELNLSKKGRNPIYPYHSREELLASLRFVDKIFTEESLEKKRDYIIQHQADVLVMGDDWHGKFDEFKDICDVVYLPRTPSISTTEIIEIIKDSNE
ncbi:Glycerol-3-phosphate cytidylyltransferase [Alteromonas sp. 38]|uniref:adenylyltransferase/cytidyltransferase family protein n=1 Tax=Alteromonas TaxID=226 RepID=UPI0012F279F5|nr:MULTISPECIES: adenylyltransferase/cytidyltransferase family protein [Alteromonas]CAD5256304.1 Glycerol-3-phosphate cytidylyltransferase [Alteromonas sp. 154]VXA94015.1 Glycerol-3-phosphate cytidylyltransferase [Alteromonas sp. 38]